MSEVVALTAVSCAVTGATLSTLKGYLNDDKKQYKLGRLLSSVIISSFTSLGLINFGVISAQLSELGFVGLIATYLLVGFGADQGLSKLDK